MTLLDTPPSPSLVPTAPAATLEITYLRPILESLPDTHKSALDVGAHKGDFTEALADLGFKVLAVEPQDYIANRFAARHADRIGAGSVVLARCAVSDHQGTADLIVGSASTVSTLEPQWTSVAFPEEFRSRRTVRVELLPLTDLLARHDLGPVGFAKIDVEGHELPALRGLFTDDVAPPAVVMFEANQRFPQQALDCLALLHGQGYHTFDIFIRIGLDPVAAGRFTNVELPPAWRACADRYFYANIIAYHDSLEVPVPRPDPVRFIQDYQLHAARALLREALSNESQHPVPVHPIWQEARLRLRDYLLEHDWHDFLRNPICKEMFVRGRWGPTQERELQDVERDAFGRELLARLRDPDLGAPRFNDHTPGISTNLLGMAWYLTRMEQQARGKLPRQIIEVGGGYGALAYTYMSAVPDAQYVIIDLPEMLAIQHYFLTLALPNHPVVFANSTGKIEPAPGTITLVPISQMDDPALRGELLVSTFALSEMPRELQHKIEQTGYFGAKRVFITGQLSTELPQLELVAHSHVVGAAMQRFPRIEIERYHIGDNYLLLGEQAAPARED